MTNLLEIERWEDGIYQLETSDPVVGGPDGIDNLQAKQLANRTRYLKRAVESGQSNLDAHTAAIDPHPQYATHADLAEKVAALVAQSPETLDTLSELAKALGNDPNFATTITSALALKAPIDSPVLTGAPKGPTPPQFDSSTRLATMAALQRALGSASSTKTVASPVVMDVTYAGADVVFYGNSGPFTQLLPAVSTYPTSVGMRFYNASAYPVTIQTAGNDKFSALGGSITSIVVGAGDNLSISAYAPSNWEVMGGSAGLQWSSLFGASLSPNGYQKLPSGLIIQWGGFVTSSAGYSIWTFPIAFPSRPYHIYAQAQLSNNTQVVTGINLAAYTQSGVPVAAFANGASYSVIALSMLAIGI
ncbi:gp53-like domain-containing protein [Burkholderia multivorans]|uniref:gp53-like domain-containing protein n=1 Tax=Burkholderia multivorans TaxID=87883 RepID=UPI002ED30C82